MTTHTPRESFSARESERAVGHSRLMAALSAELDAGGHIPCVGRADLWQSEDAADLQAAAYQCAACPVLSACRNYVTAFPEISGTWAAMKPTERTKP